MVLASALVWPGSSAGMDHTDGWVMRGMGLRLDTGPMPLRSPALADLFWSLAAEAAGCASKMAAVVVVGVRCHRSHRSSGALRPLVD